MPAEYRGFISSWISRHPGWEAVVWTPHNLPKLRFQKLVDEATIPCFKSGPVRYEMVYKYGGVYVDSDFECYRNIEPLIRNLDAFSAYQYMDPDDPRGAIAPGLFGARPRHPWLKHILDAIPFWWDPEVSSTGPRPFNALTRCHPEVRILAKKFIYPYNSWEKDKRDGPFPEAYASHHWDGSWHPSHFAALARREKEK